jgi:hypothetical protein
MGHLSTLLAQGWTVAPIYIGEQDPDPGNSSNPSTTKGTEDGNSSETNSIGLPNSAVPLLRQEGFSVETTVYLDIETSGTQSQPELDYISAWCSAVGAAGYIPGVYCLASAYSSIATVEPNAPFWIANPTNPSPTGTPFPVMDPSGSGVPNAIAWQYETAPTYTIAVPTSILASGSLQVDLDVVESTQSASETWTGAASTEWTDPGNWSGGAVPTAASNVVLDGGTVTADAPFDIGSLVLNGATLILEPGSLDQNFTDPSLISSTPLASSDVNQVYTVSSLALSNGGTLDLGNNELLINYGSDSDPKTVILQSLTSGCEGGTWTGPGIDSTAASSTKGAYGVGFADGADGVVAGLNSGQIELKYTLNGDANLDGKVNGADLTILATNFNQSVTNGWDKGDFNYDGKVNGADLLLLADNFNQGVNLNPAGLVPGIGAQYTITGSNGAQTLDILAGTVTLTSDLSALLPNYSLQIENGATVVLASDQHVGALQLVGSGSLDVSNYKMFINYGSNPDPISTIAGDIKSGFNGGAWNGTGIFSSAAAVNNKSYGLGYADSADAGNPAGLSSGQIEIKYTLLGDANLDGKVNGADFTIVANHFSNSVTAGWDRGDFNYDGEVNGADFLLLAANFEQSASQSAVSSADLAGSSQIDASVMSVPLAATPAVVSATSTPPTAAAPTASKSKPVRVYNAAISDSTNRK